MHIFGPPRPRRGGRRRPIPALAAALTAGALALLGVQAPLAQAASFAAPHTASGTAATAHTAPAAGSVTAKESGKGPSNVESVCAAPAPGRYSCMALRRTDLQQTKGLRTAGPPAGLGPADLQAAYQLPADGGEGQTIAIVDAYDDPAAESDLAVYRAQYGLPACTTDNGCFQKVDQRGGTDYPTADTGWAGEISLDLDMVSAAAPKAHILLVEADDSFGYDLGASVNTAVGLGAKYVSNSYGTTYTQGSGESPDQLTDSDYNHPGVVITASSGDDSYGVAYPAASPYVTAVGGTSLVRDSSARGWSESVWHEANGEGAGSGCSVQQPKPAFQTDTGCDHRTVADVSADADPQTGPAVYVTYGGSGWNVYGGTSASAPLIAGVYATAGTPVPDTYPNSYPYQDRSDLNDVTAGSNGTCTPAYLCTAGAGYDGPTGLGTPKGLAAFRSGPQGRISGTVTDAGTGAPVGNASVSLGGLRAHTDAQGGYLLRVPVGSYDLSVAAYGYQTYQASGVAIADGADLTRDIHLTALPTQTVTGKITDGSGHHWPLYAKVTAEGVPGNGVWTDPVTGAYSLRLPDGAAYTLDVAVAYPGYEAATDKVQLASTAVTKDFAVPADPWAADAAGYKLQVSGDTESFDSTSAAPAGWTVSNADGSDGGWEFDDPRHRGNDTGGSGGFAIADDDYPVGPMDTSLISPVIDLTGKQSPELSFQSTFWSYFGEQGTVDVTADGGRTWKTVYAETDTETGRKTELPLTDFAGAPAVQIRFHFTGMGGAWWWSVDDVFVGNRTLAPLPGGLMTGAATDANTADPLNGVTVTTPSGHATTEATPDDPAQPDGFFWAFTDSGKQDITAVKPLYSSTVTSLNVAADATTRTAFSLKAGRISVTGGPVAATAVLGKQATRTLTVKNTGTAPATVRLHEEPGTVTPATQGAPARRLKAPFSLHAIRPGASGSRTAAAQVPQAAGDAWTAVPDLPVPTEGNAVDGLYGQVYSGFGITDTEISKDAYRYDPAAGGWTKLPSATTPREAPAHGFIGGKWYVSGGWGAGGPVASTEVYDPAENTWSTAAPNPAPTLGAGTAVLDGKLYAVGGCTTEACSSSTVEVYDQATDSWSRAADYPVPVSWAMCGAIAGKLYCAGGGTDKHDWDATYVYDAAGNTWTQLADLPAPMWGSAATVANGRLLLAGGVVNGFVVNQVVAFDPAAGTWSALPNMNSVSARGGAAPGLYRVGGLDDFGNPDAGVELLPGWDQTTAADVSWMSESSDTVTVAPGASVKVTVTLDASALGTDQPGTYQGRLASTTDTPYAVGPTPVAFTVTPPATWGRISGTVLGKSAAGTVPLAGATVQISSWAATYTLTTKADGSYVLWLDARNSPLTVIVAKDGYQPTVTTVKFKKGQAVVDNVTLTKA